MTAADDPSGGWEAVAQQLIRARHGSRVGTQVIRDWSQDLPEGAVVLDLGCGSGEPVSTELAKRGFTIFGVDASPSLIAQFRRQLPHAQAECCAVESSRFFDRSFDAVVAVGLMFLLPAAMQSQLIARIGRALQDDGRFLFSAPWQVCEWNDILTGRRSVSLGAAEYERQLRAAGLRVTGKYVDEGESHYFSARKGVA